MVQDIFVYNNQLNRVELNTPEILLIKEFADLIEPTRNKCKEDPSGRECLRAFREFTYIWLAICWKSIYADYDEQTRHEEALKDAKMTEEEFNNPEFRAACRKFRDIQDSNKSIRLLQAANNMVDKFIDYFNTADPNERDELTGKPIYKVKDIQAEMKNLIDVHETMIQLEHQVKKQLESVTNFRGGVQEDFDPGEF